MAITAGTRFDRYEIISPLGSGGMGEVYLARDTRLERKIALKLLTVEFTKDAHRLSRFEQEAKAASALNHPNIITIHEIGEFGSRHFIATEFIDGRTLRQIVGDGKLSPLPAIEIGAQIASALVAAHEAGIIHRDIKPENVMARRDGIVKVLDFGLAKLTERNPPAADLDAPTLAKLDTDPGTVMGTASYMSPEQARGLRVDARTDIFSLGVLLYEMIAGVAPFNGPTAIDVMTQVLDREPRPLSSFAQGAPVELQRIVNKALRKDREERYQTVKDLLLDLKSLKRELEVTATLAYSINSSADSGAKAPVSYDTSVLPAGTTVGVSGKTPSTEPIAGGASSSEEYLVKEIKRHKRRFLAALAALLLTIAAAIYFFTGDDHEINSIAVLPFVIQNTDPNAGPNSGVDAQLLSDAITDSIINNLSQLANLNVKSRGAVLRFRGREVDPQEVARDLDVHAVLTGRILQRGGDLQVSVALVDAHDNRHLWGEQYNRKIADLLLIQQEIAREVSDKLRLKLSGEEKRRMDAHQLYLKGRNAWNKRTAEGMQEGIKYFEQATQIDPTYAPAYVGLADCYNMLVNYSMAPGKEAFPKAKAAAEKALELDQNLAEAHAALAFIHYLWEWNWFDSEREFKRAIELKPNYGAAHQWYSSLLAVMGRMDEALAEAKRAQELDRFSLIVSSHPAWINYLARNHNQAIEQARQIIKLDPNFFPARRYLALAYEDQRKYNEAIAEFQRAVSLSRDSTLVKSELGHAYAAAGKRKEAQQLIAELRQLAAERRASPYHLALIFAGLGEKDRVIELLNQAFDERAERLVWLRVDPRFDKLRADARFNDLLQRIGLAQ
ncbi:MAG: protein kinase domain-containing protein [Blastocatellia bacterium]